MADHPEAADSSSPRSGPPVRIELTEEEKSVLLECRKNSLARGFPAGVGACLFLRWLIRLDRVPLHVQRWQWFYYGGAFMMSFLAGVSSYKQKCFDKIMALENSRLADQIRAKQTGVQDWIDPTATPSEPHTGRQRRYPPRSYHEPRPSHTPSLSSKGEGYRQKKTAEPVYPQSNQDSNDITSIPIADLPQDQPDAFSGSTGSDPTPAQPMQRGRGSFEATPNRPKSRTFDEIRDENRRRQLQHYPRARRGEGETQTEQDWRQPGSQGSGKPVRRNKYGDIIEE